MRNARSMCGEPGRLTVVFLVLVALGLGGVSVRGAVGGNDADIPQFDVFVGFDSKTTEARWFPVVCEVRNEGPTFTALFEFWEGYESGDYVRQMPIELPTGTIKRFSFPMYTPGRYRATFSARLRDGRGRVIAQNSGIQPNTHLSWNSILLGALPGSSAGTPLYPGTGVRDRGNRAVAEVARLQPELMPDSPIALEALDALYLNSQRAVDLETQQVEAILSWLHGGGHLIIGVDAVLDVNGVPWLSSLMPGELGGVSGVAAGQAVFEWVRNGSAPGDIEASQLGAYRSLVLDPEFAGAEVLVAEMKVSSGDVELSAGDRPLIVSTPRERGKLTVLLFNPERQPIRSWGGRSWFWARLTDVPAALLSEERRNTSGSTSVDGVLGAIVDSKQIRKLPVSALLFLLIIYLIVIGPLDQWWLKRINRQMLTWVTFPCYVVLFSLLIWYIGYRLRAGESEWNELQIVDVIPKGSIAELQGTTYASVYSPVNATYPVSGKEAFAALRPESTGMSIGGSGKATIGIRGDQYAAELTVPVWTSELFISAWTQEGPMDFDGTLVREGDGYELTLRNERLPEGCRARLVLGDRVYEVEFPARGQSTSTRVVPGGGSRVQDYARTASARFLEAARERQDALGRDRARFELEPADATMAISVGRYIEPTPEPYSGYETRYMFPGRTDISELLDRGQALLLVYAEDYSPTPAMNDFEPVRSTRDALYRLSLAIPE